MNNYYCGHGLISRNIRWAIGHSFAPREVATCSSMFLMAITGTVWFNVTYIFSWLQKISTRSSHKKLITFGVYESSEQTW